MTYLTCPDPCLLSASAKAIKARPPISDRWEDPEFARIAIHRLKGGSRATQTIFASAYSARGELPISSLQEPVEKRAEIVSLATSAGLADKPAPYVSPLPESGEQIANIIRMMLHA
jgi:hypothetical protein